MFSPFCKIAKSVQFAIRIPLVQLILRNCEIAKSVHFTIKISYVQSILQTCEISSVCYKNSPCSVDFAKLRNQFSLLQEFPLFSWFCEIAKSVHFIIRISLVQSILQNCEISSVWNKNFPCSVDQFILRNCEISSVYYQNFPCSVDFAKLQNQFSLLLELPLFSCPLLSELMDGRECAILALELVPKNFSFCTKILPINLFYKILCFLFQQGKLCFTDISRKRASSLWQVAKIN